MIIPDSFKQSYNSSLRKWGPAIEEVEILLNAIAHEIPGLIIESRMKPIESVYIKIEKGDYEDPFFQMDDFFAATLILPFKSGIKLAIEKISDKFDIVESISQERKNTQPYDFKYNDIHIKIKLKDSESRSDKDVLQYIFELQIKTLLQSAWQKASHDIIYKPNRISWTVERVSFRLRALLELADDFLCQIEEVAKLQQYGTEELEENYKANIKQIIEIMENNFEKQTLPQDRRRMADIIDKFLKAIRANNTLLESSLISARRDNWELLNVLTLTPIEKVFLVLYHYGGNDIRNRFRSGNKRYLITKEMEDFYPSLRDFPNNARIKY